ncbi:MAG: hypothetical protein J6R47_04620 [Acholeplasmatales bacterium]|nr:hypothetical protein [Acholeplasmatales bacterium]
MKTGDRTVYLRKSDYDRLPAYSELNDAEKRFVRTRTVIDSPSLDSKYTDLYESKNIWQESPFYNGRALTEQNISSILRKLTDKASYVIYKGDNFIEFIIKGHYFTLSDPIILAMKPLYVEATFKDIGTDNEQLDGYDYVDPAVTPTPPSKFLALNFSSNSDDFNEDDLNKEVLQLSDEVGNIPIESKFRFTENVVKNISGGTV